VVFIERIAPALCRGFFSYETFLSFIAFKNLAMNIETKAV